MYQEQHQGKGSFGEIYGHSPFLGTKIITPKSDSTVENNKPVLNYSDEDKLAAQHYTMLIAFGSPLFPEDIDGNSLQGALLLLWWYLGMEEPYDPHSSLSSFKDACIEKIKKEIDYWESSQTLWEKIVRGTYGTLFDHKEGAIVDTMTRTWEELIEQAQNSPEMEGKDPVDILMYSLTQVMADPSKTYSVIKELKEERECAKQEKDGKTKKRNTKHKSWKSILVAVASVTVSVGLVAGLAFFAKKKWHK